MKQWHHKCSPADNTSAMLTFTSAVDITNVVTYLLIDVNDVSY